MSDKKQRITITNDMSLPDVVKTANENPLEWNGLEWENATKRLLVEIVNDEIIEPVKNYDGTYTYTFNYPVSFSYEVGCGGK